MFILFFSILTITLVILCYYLSIKNYDYWKKKKIDYIEPTPFFGCMWPNVCLKKTAGEILKNIYNQINKDFIGIYVFHRPILLIKSPKLIKHICIKDFEYFRDRTAVAPQNNVILSNLMFFKRGPEWKIARAKMSPVFTSTKLKLMFDVILKEGDLMIDYINRKCANVPNTIAKEICAKYTTNVIGRCGFGIEANCFKNENAEFRTLGRRTFDFRLSTSLRHAISFFFPTIAKLFGIGFFEVYVVHRLRDIFNEVLQQRIKMKSLNGVDLIDTVLEQHRQMTHEDFSPEVAMAQAIQFFFAGYETTSVAFSFVIYELTVNPDIQDKLRKEIQASIKEHDGALTNDGLMNLKYLDLVVLETLRKYPSIAFLDRECLQDYKIPGTDFVLEKGIGVYIPLFGLYHDEKYFPNPEKFIPERFEEKSKINQNDGLHFLPFGEGPRNCIGMRFALVALKIGIAKLLLNFELARSDQTPEILELEVKAILTQSKDGVPITFKKL